MELIIGFFIWPAIAFGFLLAYGWYSGRRTEQPRDVHKVPGE